MNFFRQAGADLFSFGDETDAPDLPVAGLRFDNQALDFFFSLESPSDLRFVLDSRQMLFDTAKSTARVHSLFRKMPLTLAQLVTDTAGQKPEQSGFVPVKMVGVTRPTMLAAQWFGLAFTANLGTVGALAAAAGLSARLLAAWSPAAQSPVQLLLSLPGLGTGKKEISLQNVLKLSVGELVLTTQTGGDGEIAAYVLKLRDIGLAFLGKKLPPSGVTDIALFGADNPTEGKSALSWYAVYVLPEPATLLPIERDS